MRAKTKNTSRLLLSLAVVTAVVFMMTASASASHADIVISIPIDTVVHAPVDSTTLLATADVPADFADHFCEVRAHSENQQSVHSGNDLVVESGDSMVLLADVEAKPQLVIETDDLLELGEQITVSLIMGPDEVFSAGIEVVVECLAEETTTTTAEVAPTEATTTTVEVSPTQVTTTQAPSTSAPEEVLGTEVLPFTGSSSQPIGLLALGMLACGALLVIGARRAED